MESTLVQAARETGERTDERGTVVPDTEVTLSLEKRLTDRWTDTHTHTDYSNPLAHARRAFTIDQQTYVIISSKSSSIHSRWLTLTLHLLEATELWEIDEESSHST